jgi:hypothetical protein
MPVPRIAGGLCLFLRAPQSAWRSGFSSASRLTFRLPRRLGCRSGWAAGSGRLVYAASRGVAEPSTYDRRQSERVQRSLSRRGAARSSASGRRSTYRATKLSKSRRTRRASTRFNKPSRAGQANARRYRTQEVAGWHAAAHVGWSIPLLAGITFPPARRRSRSL